MAWRIDEQVIRGEIDNTVRGRVTGRIWLVGRDQPVELDLEGNPWRDLAGTRLTFNNPARSGKDDDFKPDRKQPDMSGFDDNQKGVTGDITASRKVRVPDVSMEEFRELYRKREPFPWHWGNSLYLEWFSFRNGRVVIESAAYELVISPERTWEMNEEDEIEQRKANAAAMENFMDRMVEAFEEDAASGDPDFETESESDDPPISEIERKADEEAARMDLLLDRIQARLDKAGDDVSEESMGTIMREERERLRKERGEPEPEPLTPEQEAERQKWMEEMNEAAAEVAREAEANKWKGEDNEHEDDDFFREHPLALTTRELASRLHHEIKAGGWLPESAQQEHPLAEVRTGTMIASAKLAGALTRFSDEDQEWPPDELCVGDTLVRLKKAREALRDSLAGLDAADEQRLATPEWRSGTRAALQPILSEVDRLIAEIRESL